MSYKANNKPDHKQDFEVAPKTFGRCYESHPALPIGEFLIYGGSCITPSVKDADIYVGFDVGMERSHKRFPWIPGESFLFPIQDMGVPPDLLMFKDLLAYLSVQLTAQKKVHMGCIGGHGRTGLVMAALVKMMTGNEDAITYVRKNYCHKAVESAQQIRYLNEHFGIKEVSGSKESSHSHKVSSNTRFSSDTGFQSPFASLRPDNLDPRYEGKPISKAAGATSARSKDTGPEKGTLKILPTCHPMSVWGQDFKITSLTN